MHGPHIKSGDTVWYKKNKTRRTPGPGPRRGRAAGPPRSPPRNPRSTFGTPSGVIGLGHASLEIEAVLVVLPCQNLGTKIQEFASHNKIRRPASSTTPCRHVDAKTKRVRTFCTLLGAPLRKNRGIF